MEINFTYQRIRIVQDQSEDYYPSIFTNYKREMQVENNLDFLLETIQGLEYLTLDTQEGYCHKKTGQVTAQKMGWNDTQETNQFYPLYLDRLEQFSSRFPQLTNITPLAKIDSNFEGSSKIQVIGIIKMLQVNRIRVFDKDYLSMNQKIMNELDTGNLSKEEDQLEIEDKTGKMKFLLNYKNEQTVLGNRVIKKTDLPFGIVVGIIGKFNKKWNRITVSEIILPITPNPQPPLANIHTDSSVLVVSEPSIQYLVNISDVLTGKKQRHYSKIVRNVCCIIIIGGINLESTFIKNFEEVIAEMNNSIDVMIMPSVFTSKSNMLYPHTPYKRILFPKLAKQGVKLVSNPQLVKFSESGVEMLVSAGQNVKDLMRNCTLGENDIETMEWLLKLNHICPTSPYSMKSTPYIQDHLLINRMPNIFLSGNSTQFISRQVQINQEQVRLISLPKNTITLINVSSKQAIEVKIQ